MLGAAEAVLRSGVVVADTGVERPGNGGARLVLGHVGHHAGESGAAETERRDAEAGPADLTGGDIESFGGIAHRLGSGVKRLAASGFCRRVEGGGI